MSTLRLALLLAGVHLFASPVARNGSAIRLRASRVCGRQAGSFSRQHLRTTGRQARPDLASGKPSPAAGSATSA